MSEKKKDLDYSLVCRTCLQSNVELLFLSALINDNLNEESSKISYKDCLKMCIQLKDTPDCEMPQKICLECASALQVSYWFIKNANQADHILRLKLADIKRKQQRLNEMQASPDITKPKRYRCKICNERVETKRSLKDHVKLHLDIIVYNCQLCSFESHNRNNLSDHYIQIHAIEPTREQLKPKTKLSAPSSHKCSINDCMDGAIKSDHFQILPEENSKSKNSFQKLSMNSLCNVEPPQVSTILAQNCNYNTKAAAFNIVSGEVNNDLNIANEFMVMTDGSLERVINKGVVIEYIDAQNNNNNLTLNNGLLLDNIINVQNIDHSLMLEQDNVIEQMDVDDLIIEDPGDMIEETQVQENIILPLEEAKIPATIMEQPKKIMCKICTKDFLTQEQLKNHMLTHNEIPHFFCDQCKFYTFFKIDLHQHYKSKHNMQPTNKQLQPKNKQRTINEYFACDLCFYETETKFEMQKHYKTKHNVVTHDTQLKPTKVERIKSKCSPLTAKAKAAAIKRKPTISGTEDVETRSKAEETPDYPNGLNCRKCKKVFYWRKQLYEHYKMHSAEEAALKQAKQIIKVQNKPISTNVGSNKTNNIKTQFTQISNTTNSPVNTTHTATYACQGSMAFDVSSSNLDKLNDVATLMSSSSSNYTLPSDAIPQIVETDQTVEINGDFDFNCDDDVLFQDFDDNVDVENDSNDNDLEFRNVLLTSDDDFEDKSHPDVTYKSLCAHCQKSFSSQYQFENHMFLHRGLAPYRCEMCTNLYNTKRCLIRHYKAVHQNVPTRDMIQAKGDKVCDDKIVMEHFKIEPTICFMCGKCPYESSDLNSLKYHLKSSHNIDDEAFIIKKLPFECPRCIRSFANKMLLLRHLERNHSLIPFNQPQNIFDSENNTKATTTSSLITSITTTSNDHVNMMKTDTIETIETNASCGYNDLFIEKEQQQYNCPDAVASHSTMTTFKESTSPTRHLVYNKPFANNDAISVPVMPSTSNKFITLSNTTTDLNKNDDKSQPIFKCKICFMTCYSLANFNEHSKSVECRKISVGAAGDKMLFECGICHCNYKTIYLLKHHLKRHIGRKFLCADCPKTFINKVELKAHKHVHSGERPHKCDVCTKSFRYVHHLKRHKDSIHYGKRHSCTEANCSRNFTTLTQLKLHLWAHNGIVPYKCPFCNRLFKKRLLLREHCVKIHSIHLSEEEMGKIFRKSLGYTNPHDFTVTIGNGKMLRRGDLETMSASGVVKCSFE